MTLQPAAIPQVIALSQAALRSPAPNYANAIVSEEFPYESKYVDILGSKMHYIETYFVDSEPRTLARKH